MKILKGEESISRVLDDVYSTLKNSGGEVYVSGVDERKFIKTNRSAITAHIKRLAKAGINEKLLAKEGDLFFFAGKQSAYRWVPENLFNPTPMYVYGDKVAIIVWGSAPQVLIIKNEALADAYRKQFTFIWERAKVPPTRNDAEDEKTRLEQALIRRFGGRISSITDKDTKTFRGILSKEKGESYGNSFYYLCQAANGTGEQRLGLKYFDGEMLAAIGIFNRKSLGGGWHFFINHPVGKFNTKKLATLAKAMLELSGNPVFLKKVSGEQKTQLLKVGFSDIEVYPWHSQAMEEDDTFPEQIIDIEKTLEEFNTGSSNNSKQYRKFVAKYDKEITPRNLEESTVKDARDILKQFFEYLETRELHISQITDYDNIIAHPPLGKNGNTHFSQVLYLKDLPIALFAAEPISNDTAGLFANITLHQEVPYLSEYLIVYICKILKQAGFKYLNLGGSETGGLFQFKDKFSPVEYRKMHWVVYKY